MKTPARFVLAWFLVLGWIGPAHAAVQVTFVQPEQYLDAYRYSEADLPLRSIEQHLQALGETYLPTNVTLTITVLDFDLVGGRDITRHSSRDTRVLKGRADWPSARLRYVLEADGRVLLRGEETIADRDYMGRLNRYPASDPLRHEKRMLDEWFQARFVERKLPDPRDTTQR